MERALKQPTTLRALLAYVIHQFHKKKNKFQSQMRIRWCRDLRKADGRITHVKEMKGNCWYHSGKNFYKVQRYCASNKKACVAEMFYWDSKTARFMQFDELTMSVFFRRVWKWWCPSFIVLAVWWFCNSFDRPTDHANFFIIRRLAKSNTRGLCLAMKWSCLRWRFFFLRHVF